MNILGFAIKPDPEPKEAPEHLQLTKDEIEQYRQEDIRRSLATQDSYLTAVYERTIQLVNQYEQAADQSYRWYR